MLRRHRSGVVLRMEFRGFMTRSAYVTEVRTPRAPAWVEAITSTRLTWVDTSLIAWAACPPHALRTGQSVIGQNPNQGACKVSLRREPSSVERDAFG